MATTRGKAAAKAYMREAPAKLANVVRGAARAGAAVISDEIKLRTPSDEVRENLRTRVRTKSEAIVVTIDLPPGWARSVGTWLEYGTSPHYITVDDSQRDGKSVSRINTLHKAGTLVINGKPVGSTVFHPGTRAEPTFRTALDAKEREAVATAQSFIDARVTRKGIAAVPTEEGD